MAIRIYLVYATHCNFKVFQVEIKRANGELQEEVYVEQPPRFEDGKLYDFIYILFKALYELKQASRVWYDTLSIFLLKNQFTRDVSTKTLFQKYHGNNINLMLIYIYDIIVGSTNGKICERFTKLMRNKYEMSTMGELSFFLHLQIY